MHKISIRNIESWGTSRGKKKGGRILCKANKSSVSAGVSQVLQPPKGWKDTFPLGRALEFPLKNGNTGMEGAAEHWGHVPAVPMEAPAEVTAQATPAAPWHIPQLLPHPAETGRASATPVREIHLPSKAGWDWGGGSQ